jgi:hypothetical protein
MKSHVADLDSNLEVTHGDGYNAPLVGATPANRPFIRSEFKLVMDTANQDQPPFSRLNELLNKCVNDHPLIPSVVSIGQAGGHSNKQ